MRGFFLAIGVFTLTTSCATIFHKGNQRVEIQSNQNIKGVHIDIIDGLKPFETKLPTSFTVYPTSTHLQVAISDPCYERESVLADRKINSYYWLNFFNFFGFGIDLFTGAAWDYDPIVYIDTRKLPKCLPSNS